MGGIYINARKILFMSLKALSLVQLLLASEAAMLPEEEVGTLTIIASRLGKEDWDFTVNPCSGKYGWVTENPIPPIENNVTCDCSFLNNTVCHITAIVLKGQNLSGVLPPEAASLPFLKTIDLTRNYLSGNIPPPWAILPLENLSLSANRLSGTIPKEIGNITTLRNLTIEANSFSGPIPPELGNLINLQKLVISSNKLVGELPTTLSKLTNLTDLRISDNGFSGKLPLFLRSWTLLQKLHVQGCSFQGSIPIGISALEKLTDLRISNLNGTGSEFPLLSGMQSMKILILRNCFILGNIPYYLGNMKDLKTLDLSFNNLRGEIPRSFESLSKLDYMYLTGNMLTGSVPDWIQKKDINVDLSYNAFTRGNLMASSCQVGKINLVSSYSFAAYKLSGIASCLDDPRFAAIEIPYCSSLHINCGGERYAIDNNTYEADQDPGGPSSFYLSPYWAFSNTGDFMDDSSDSSYIVANNTDILTPNLYTTARTSPLSLTYYGVNLINGHYTVKLHFAEIVFTDDNTFSSLGRRIFDVYIQGNLVMKDFNIEDEAGGIGIPVVKSFSVNVMSHTLEIRLYWTGKGTQVIPRRGVYGPLISAISVEPGFRHKHKLSGKAVALITSGSLVVFWILFCGILAFGGCFEGCLPEPAESVIIKYRSRV